MEAIRSRVVGAFQKHENPVLRGTRADGRPSVWRRLDGDYHVESRRLGSRNRDPNKYLNDAATLEADLARDPHNSRNMFYLLNVGRWGL